jgi:MauM/NapG family ferredoxin protein
LKRISSRSMGFVLLARVACQALFFALFLVLLFNTRSSGKETIGAVERFFHFDPLLGLATMVASRSFQATYGLALITVLVTVLFGRYVCGWICPLGSLLHFFSFLFAKLKWTKLRLEKAVHLRWKYLVLTFILVASVFTADFAGYLDPLSFLYRSFTAAVFPAAANMIGSGTALFHRLGWSVPSEHWQALSQNLMIHTTFRQGTVIGLVLLAIILLNLVRPRFWCRYICPAGALLGVFARWHLIKPKTNDACSECQLCSIHCPSQASPYPNEQWKKSECFHCYKCAATCPRDATRFPLVAPESKSPSVDLSRRDLVLASAFGVVAAPLLKVSASERASERLIRPPGALAEAEFLAKCVRCGECIKVCPTNGLQNATNEGGLLGYWTPVLVPRIGHCEYYCSLCTQVCPTGAIRELTVKQKQETRIGAAWIRKQRCAPYALGESCRVCEQKCPTSPKAIVLVDAPFTAPDGAIPMKAPIVDLSLCIGCGLCEAHCPMEDETGIYCTNYGESRSARNFEMPVYSG